MPSRALIDLRERLTDIDQLFQAHIALTKFKKAEASVRNAGGGLQNLAAIVNALVTTPGRGRPREVAALNRSAVVLLCALFQGFVRDLHRETATITLNGKTRSVEDTIALVTPRNSNPHPDVIDCMFAGVGVYDLMASPRWHRCSNATVRKRLSAYIELRNTIAHGRRPAIHKTKVKEFKTYVERLAQDLDRTVATKIETETGRRPW